MAMGGDFLGSGLLSMSNAGTNYNLAGGGGGFGLGQLFSNPLVLQMMARMGASLDPEGPAGAIGGVANQWIQNQSYMKMMQKMLGCGAKLTFDGKTGKYNVTGEDFNKLAGSFGTGGKGGGEFSSYDWT